MKRILPLALLFIITACSQAEFSSLTANPDEKPTIEEGMDNPALLAGFPCNSELTENSKKVQICHVPPGNPANRHTICIGRPALKAHLSKHEASTGESDYLGECVPGDDEVVTDDPDDCDQGCDDGDAPVGNDDL